MPDGLLPFAVLGLRPGASRGEVDKAYRRLIKLHHPDRNGGDSQAAAEINRAYALLKRHGADEPLSRQVNVAPPSQAHPEPKLRWIGPAALGAITAVMVLVPLPSGLAGVPRVHAPAVPTGNTEDAAVGAVAQDPSLGLLPVQGAVSSGVAEAVRLARIGGRDAVDAYGRSCADDLKRYPGSALLDHCIAFDTAAASLMSGLPVGARPAVGEVEVSNDPVLAHTRVVQVRRQALRLVPEMRERTSRQ